MHWLIFLLFTQMAFADVMNLNEFSPTRLEDASPAKEHKFDFQVTSIFERNNPDDMQYRFNPRYGLSKKAQLEASTTWFSGGGERESGRSKLGGLYMFTESDGLKPKISLIPLVVFPTGKYDQGLGLDTKFAFSWTLSGTSQKPDAEIHLNVGNIHNGKIRSNERYNQHLLGLGYSLRVLEKTAWVVDIFHEQERRKTEEQNLFESGIEQDLGNHTFISAGFGLPLGAGPSWSGNLTFIKQI